MSTNPGQILVPATASFHIGDVGSTAPTDVSTTLNAAFKDCGLFTTDSLQFSTEPQFEEVTSMQSSFPTRRFQTGESGSVNVDLQQWNPTTIRSAFGGGTITETATNSNVFKFVPPRLGQRGEVACIIHVVDGTKIYRFVFPRCQQVEGSEIGFNKTGASNLSIRLSLLGGDNTDAWYMLTNDPAFDIAA